jgi:hypothetical protein
VHAAGLKTQLWTALSVAGQSIRFIYSLYSADATTTTTTTTTTLPISAAGIVMHDHLATRIRFGSPSEEPGTTHCYAGDRRVHDASDWRQSGQFSNLTCFGVEAAVAEPELAPNPPQHIFTWLRTS